MAGPSRPFTERDTLHMLNGCPVYLGVLQSSSSSSAVNNNNTATPFWNGSTPPTTLAGKTLLIQPDANGCLLPLNVTTGALANAAQAVQTQSTSNVNPGLLVTNGTSLTLIMLPTAGFLSWVSAGAGAANLYVWELR